MSWLKVKISARNGSKYCGLCEHKGSFGAVGDWSNDTVYCAIFGVVLPELKRKILRCKECLDAEVAE